MIIEPDFLTHWKTEFLVNRCGDAGVVCLLRLWAHGQMRKTQNFFNMTPELLEAIARWKGDAGVFFQALLDSAYIDVKDDVISLHQFEDYNAKLFKNWKNGVKGGRPPSDKNGKNKVGLTQPKPKHNPPKNDENFDEDSENDDLEDSPENDDLGSVWVNPNDENDKKNNLGLTQTKPNNNPKPENGGWVRFGVTDRIDRIDRIDKESKKKKNADKAFLAFLAEFKKSPIENLTADDDENLISAYASWIAYKAEKKTIYKVATGAKHFALIKKLLEVDELNTADIVGMFEQAISSEWVGFFFPEKIAKIKTDKERQRKFAQNNKPPLDDYDSFGIPQGAKDFNG